MSFLAIQKFIFPLYTKRLPKKLCDAHMLKQDETVVLVDEDDQELQTKLLVEKTGLSGGRKGFVIAHKLYEGDALQCRSM
ncbi:putative transcription factor B3-Domain family [Helianthus debilis subsp. tardiflorus]